MDALVLSGGSIKIAWQAGAIAHVLGSGYAPRIITGTSAGGLCTAYLAAYQQLGWPVAGAMLAGFIEERVTGPRVIARKRHVLELVYRIWRKRWKGLVDTTPLERLVRETLSGSFPIRAGIQARVCSVNLKTGAKAYVGADDPAFLDAVLASTAEPVVMPARMVKGDTHVDGGLAEIAPLAEAIRLGATRIVCVVCQPEKVRVTNGNWGDLCALLGRETLIASTEIVNDDIRTCRDVNARVVMGEAPDKRYVELTVIRPERQLPIALDSFTGADIRRMVALGRADAHKVLGEDGLPQAA